MSNEIAVVDDATAPSISSFDIVDVQAVSDYMDNYQELVEALLDETDYQMIKGKRAKKKSAWRKLATAFKISDEIVSEELTFDEVNQIVTARYKVRATLPNGRSTIGVGVCSIYDKIRYSGQYADSETPSNFVLRGRFSHAEHDVPSTAHTRAKNRAIADLIGAGEVSAEELDLMGEEDSSNAKSVTRKTNGKSRRVARRKPAAPKEEVIETNVVEAEVVTDAKGFEDIDDASVQKAIARLKENSEEITKSGIVDELFNLYDLGTIDMDEYEKAKETLEI